MDHNTGRDMDPIARPPSLVDAVADQLRRMIVSGELALGQPLSERQFAEAFGVSKTPIREALVLLKGEGLVQFASQKRARVFSLSGQEILDICEWRQTLEVAALRLAAERNRAALVAELAAVVGRMRDALDDGAVRAYLAEDSAFHNAFFRHCGNALFLGTYLRMQAKIAALRTHLAAKPSHTDRSFVEHVAMVELLGRGDAESAEHCLIEHIDRTRNSYSRTILDISKA